MFIKSAEDMLLRKLQWYEGMHHAFGQLHGLRFLLCSIEDRAPLRLGPVIIPSEERAMTPMIRHRIDHPSAWKSSDFAGEDDFSLDLEPRHLRALDAALHRVRKQGLDAEDIVRDQFPLEGAQDLIEEMRNRLLHGSGFLMLRGWPVEQYSLEDLGAMYCGFGTHFGTAVSQSVMGDRLGYVTDHSHEDMHERAYRHRYELALHTDFSELIAMLCVRTAATGGESQHASAFAVHNEMLATRADLLPSLYDGFHYHRRGEEAPGQPPVTPHKVPIFSTADGMLSARFIQGHMPAAAKELGIEMPADLLEAIACFEEIAARDDFKLDLLVAPGEMTFVNNLIVMHGRSTFEDDAQHKRLFLRLWLDVELEHRRPRVPELSVHENDCYAKQEGRVPVYRGAAWEEVHEEHVVGGMAADTIRPTP